MTRKRSLSRSNPAKLERCVKAVQKRGGAANAYAVCTAAQKKARTKKNKAYRGKDILWQAGPRFVVPGVGEFSSLEDAKRAIDNTFGRKTAGKRKNPATDEYEAAAEASEEFHGAPPHEDIEIKQEIFEHTNLADCGELRKMEIIALNNDLVDLKGFAGARLARSPKGYPPQLYIEGGDQSVDLAEFGITNPHENEVLGHLKFITYFTIKHHLGKDGGKADYRHRFNDGESIRIGTKSKNRPTVLYDVNNKLLSIAGGEYDILPEGIDN